MWALAAGPLLFAADLNPDTPTSILAAVCGIGSLVVTALVYDRTQLRKEHAAERAEWKLERAEMQRKLDTCTADATNRERQLGQEVYPTMSRMVDVLSAANRLTEASINAQQHPAQTPPGIDPETIRRIVVEALEARP